MPCLEFTAPCRGGALPTHYQGVAIYCDWETSEVEWTFWREHFCRTR